MFADELQEKLNQHLLRSVDNPGRGAEGALDWLSAARCNYQKDARLGRLTEESVQQMLKRLDQAEALI